MAATPGPAADLAGGPLPAPFYDRDAVALAPDLLGRLLVREVDGLRLVGRIVEVEAYGTADPASHAYRGPTRRNRSMFGPPGRAYVYLSHGTHHCLNVVGRAPTAVLVRALEPIEGIEAMAGRRGIAGQRLLCAGPGRLCRALGLTLLDDGADLTAGRGLWIATGARAPDVVATPRIGIRRAADRPWRFVVRGSPFASRLAR